MDFDKEIDAVGLLCPLPVLRARKVLEGMQTGEVLRLTADDQMALVDMPHFCSHSGHEFLKAEPTDLPPMRKDSTVYAFLIRKGGQ